jgi:serine/threonine protein kinase
MDPGYVMRAAASMQFEFGEKLGEGSYGEVWKAKDRKTDETRALKKIKDDEGGVPYTAYREITLLERIQTMDSSNNNIVRSGQVLSYHSCLLSRSLYVPITASLASC